MADVVLVLPSRSCTMVEPGAISSDIEEEPDEEKESDIMGVETSGDINGRQLGAQAAAGAADVSRRGIRGIRGSVLDKDGGRRPTAASLANEGAAKRTSAKTRFRAHSMVLTARSEKFAAMLRFVRRQADDGHVGVDRDDGPSIEEMGVAESADRPRGMGCWATQSNDCEECRAVSSCGLERGNVGAPEEALCGELRNGGNFCGVNPLPSARSCRSPRHGQRRRPLRRPRRDPTPRQLELHSPLLSPRSLGLFLEFLYTGVLNPSLSAGELSELALIADEYLVPDLTRQVEALLVESLVRCCRDPSPECCVLCSVILRTLRCMLCC